MDERNGLATSGACERSSGSSSDLTVTFLSDHRLFHSEFQMDHFITQRSGGTPYGCYKQALREWHKRYRGESEFRYNLGKLKIRLAAVGRKSPTSESGKEMRRLKLEFLSDRLSDAEFARKENLRELEHFTDQCRQLKAIVGELTPERRAELDSEMYEFRAYSALALDYLAFGHPQRITFEMIQSLPPKIRRRVGWFLPPGEHRNVLTEWFLTYSPAKHGFPRIDHVENPSLCQGGRGICGEREECFPVAISKASADVSGVSS
jgi:hypothetical protein